MREIQAVIFDWAGTTVDFGCFAPLDVFIKIFDRKGISITQEEARTPMGMAKKDHVKAILEMPRIVKLWQEKFGQPWQIEDLDELYSDFEPSLLTILPNYTEVLDGVVDTCEELRSRGIRIGSTTGYTSEMMDIVKAGAAKEGYAPDTIVTAEMVSSYGRPAPFMIFQNMETLGVYPAGNVIKVGDTISDIQEGVNAGAISVGIVIGSSIMGLTKQEFQQLDATQKEVLCKSVEKSFLDAGAHFTIRTISELIPLIDRLNDERK